MGFSQNPSSGLLPYLDSLPALNPLFHSMNERFALGMPGSVALLAGVMKLKKQLEKRAIEHYRSRRTAQAHGSQIHPLVRPELMVRPELTTLLKPVGTFV